MFKNIKLFWILLNKKPEELKRRLLQSGGDERYEFIKKGLTALSELKPYPDGPNLNIKTHVMDAGVWWEDIEVVNDFKLQRNKFSKHYRILDPEKKRITYGNEEEINNYLGKCLYKVKNKNGT